MTPKVRTVLGDIDPSSMTGTLPHEHIFGDCDMYWYPGDDPRANSDRQATPTVDNLWHWMENPVANRGNLHLSDEQDAIDELSVLPELGVNTVVNLSPIDMGRNVTGLRAASRATNVNIVAGTSYYVAASLSEDVKSQDQDSITQRIVDDITVGMDGTDVRAGIVGEVGLSWPLEPEEERILAASVAAHLETGAALTIHNPYYVPGTEALREIAGRIEKLGADMTRVVMGHCDGFARDPEFLNVVPDLGCLVELDMFAYPSGYEPEADFTYPSDETRVNTILGMVEAGLAHRLLISHDVMFKTTLQKFGGHGYGYIHRMILPWLSRKGVSDDTIEQITVRNARELLPLRPAREAN